MRHERRRIAAQAVVLFTLALGVRLLHFAAMRGSLLYDVLLADAGQYDRWAQRIAAGEWLGSDVFYQTPLYPYLLGALYGLAGHEPWAVRGLQAVFGALSSVFLARAGAGFFSERAGWLTGLVLALYPPAIFFDGILQKASLDLLLMSALLWLAAATQRRPTRVRLGACGAVLGALVLNRENAAALAPLLLVWAASLGWDRGRARAAAHAAVFALGVAAVLVPVGLRNLYVGGAFLVTTSQMGSNFYIGNHRGADGGYTPMRAGRGDAKFERDDARLLAEDALKRPLGPGEVSRYWLSRAWEDIRSAPAEWGRLIAWKWFLTWNRAELVDAEAIHTHALESPLLGALDRVLHFGVVLPLAAAGAWWTRRRARSLWLLYGMALTFAASVTVFYVFARYRYPLVPIAALFAGAGLEGAWRRAMALRSGGGARELAVAMALVACVALFSNWPFPQRYDDDAITFYNAGTELLDVGRLQDALALLERARLEDPSFPETYANLGRAWLMLDDVAAARAQLERGIALAPGHAILHLNLAAALARQGDVAQTRASLERAIRLDPLLVAAYGPLAEIEARAGDVTAAVGHLRRAVELAPDSAAAHADLAFASMLQGDAAGAVRELRAALRLDPSLTPARNRLAWILATTPDAQVRDTAEALALARELDRATGGEEPEILEVLAAAEAANGGVGEAAAISQRAAGLARSHGDGELAARLERQRSVYLTGRALHELPLIAGPSR